MDDNNDCVLANMVWNTESAMQMQKSRLARVNLNMSYHFHPAYFSLFKYYLRHLTCPMLQL